jgi:DNA-binding Lrp family transcriptional regulator
MWTDGALLSTHGRVLVELARRPALRLRELAAKVGITERATQGIVRDLVEGGYLERIKEGRRNRYLVRGERPLPDAAARGHEVSDLLDALVSGPAVPPSSGACAAVVLACSDYRYQEPLRTLLAAEGLLGRAEVMQVLGGASALSGRDGGRILAGLEFVTAKMRPERVLLTAHHGCWVPGAFVSHRRDPFATRRAVAERRRKTVDLVSRRLGHELELWFLDERGAYRVGRRGRSLAPQATSAAAR